MPDIIQMQSMARSRLDQSKLASFDQEVIEAPHPPAYPSGGALFADTQRAGGNEHTVPPV